MGGGRAGHRIFPHSLCHSPGPATVRSGERIIGDVTQDGDSDPDQRSAHIRPAETISNRPNNGLNEKKKSLFTTYRNFKKYINVNVKL